MDQQVIQELDIIIKAKCEDARKDIKKLVSEFKSASSSIEKDMKTINSTGTMTKLTEGLKDGQKEVQKLKDELGNIKIHINGEDLEVKADMSNYDEVMEEYDHKLTEKIEEYNRRIEEYRSQHPFSESTSTSGFKTNNKSGSELNDNLKSFDALTIGDQIKTIGMQIEALFPKIKSLKQAINDVFNEPGRLIPAVKQAINDVFNEPGRLIPAVKQSFSEMGASMANIKGQVSSALEPVKTKLSEVKGKASQLPPIFSNMGKVAKNSASQAADNFKEMAEPITKPISKLRQLISKIKDTGNESTKTKKQTKSFGTDISKSFSSGIKSIKNFAMSLLSVRTVFTAVSKASQAYLSFDTQLSDSIQNSWNVLGSLLAPALEYVASLFSKLVSAIANFVKSLTGIDLVAKANAKALDNQSKSAQKASKSLASIDDIDNLSTSSGDDTTTLTVEDIDTTPFDKFFKKVQEIFSKIFDPFKLAWENVGTGVFDSMKSMVTSIGDLGSSVGNSLLEVWTNGTGEQIVTNILSQYQQVFDIIGGIADALTHAWNNAGNGTSIIQNIADIFETIQEWGLLIGDSILQWVVSDSFQEALDKVFGFIDDIFGIVKDICEWLLDMYKTYIKPVIDDKLLPAIDSITIAVMDIWNTVEPVVKWIIEKVKNVLEPVIKGLSDFIGGIIDVVKGIADFVSGVFTGDWKKAWNGVKTIFKGIWDSLSSIIKTPINLILAGIENMVNAIIKAFNAVKKALNKISFDIPDWVPVIGGEKWGFDLKMSDEVKLPRLKSGNVAEEPTIGIFGEYANARQNPEITSPVSIMADTFRSVLSEADFGGTRFEKLIINVADENFYQGTVDYINSENLRKGVNVIKEA